MPQEAALAASTAAAHGVAVCYSGWLGVAVPSRGLTARQALVDPLGADVYVAGTYFPAEDAACTPDASSGQRGGDDCYRHLWRRLDGLAPLAGKALEPMPSYETLEERVARSPHWRAIRAAYNPAKTYQKPDHLLAAARHAARQRAARALVLRTRVRYHVPRRAAARRALRSRRLLAPRVPLDRATSAAGLAAARRHLGTSARQLRDERPARGHAARRRARLFPPLQRAHLAAGKPPLRPRRARQPQPGSL